MSRSTEFEHHEGASLLSLELEQNREAPALARAAISGFCQDRDIDATTLATLTLLVSEMVTNAVIHPDVDPTTTIGLHARLAARWIEVRVTDHGSGFTPKVRDPGQIGGGYGLYLLDRSASRWGVDTTRDTTVWFELGL
jgi:anti-sigma regulatory factor (Ser/Thr protein kinase)